MNVTLLASIISLVMTQPVSLPQAPPLVSPLAEVQPITQPQSEILATRKLSLANRHQTESINAVFRKNILLNLAYFSQSVSQKSEVDWNLVEQPSTFHLTLQPGETFAYHDDVLPEYQSTVITTTRAHFDSREGFLSSGFLFGDGVCHLASVMNWAAQDAGLAVTVTKKHTIAKIPDIPDEYGVSIYTRAGVKGSGARNNLCITNNQPKPIEFIFDYQENMVSVTVKRSA